MNDSDWPDPFADDEAARERAARRAERAARRRERELQHRQSLSERVREELTGTAVETPVPPTERPADSAEQPAPPAPPAPRIPERPGSGARPPRRPRTSAQVRHRRTVALLIVGAIIVLVAGVGVVLSRSGDDDGAAPAAKKAQKTFELTIPEGYDRAQIAGVAKKAGVKGNYEKASKSARGFDLKGYGASGAESLEGFLFPATYELFKRDDAGALVGKQLEAFEANLSQVDLSRAEREGLSVYEVVTIASMIEREIQVPEERELAASVIYNRLEANNPLGIDATIRFEDQNYDEPLLESRLNADTPYNTHTNPGLPPGPIGNPGLASLEAAANPADTDFFYYVIKPGTCNEHEFVETQAEFDAAVARYSEARDAAGGKSPTEC
jgi:hypothetical protein